MKSTSSLLLALSALACIALTGCVERKITIASDPPGALVYLNDVEVGRTPLTVPFLWDGDYDIRANQNINVGTLNDPKVIQYSYHGDRKTTVPVYEWIPIDLFAELLPIRFVDQQFWAIALTPAPQPSDDQLVKSGIDLKAQLNSPTDLKRPQETKTTPPAKPVATPSTRPAQP